jgi:hypothetical protein
VIIEEFLFLLRFFKTIITLKANLEILKEDLACQDDFNVVDCFRFFDRFGKTAITGAEFEVGLK